MLRIVYLFFASVLSFEAYACAVAPKHIYKTPNELIKESKQIVLAELVSARKEQEKNNFIFEIREVLKGDASKTVSVSVPNQIPGLTVSLGSHKQYSFWTHHYSGTGFGSDCELRPSFGIGHSYLLFIGGGNPSLRSYEEIIYDDDRWVNYVRQYLSGKEHPKPILELKELVNQFNEIHLFACPGEGVKGKPKLVESFKGVLTEYIPRPKKPLRCIGTSLEYLVMLRDEDNPALIIPVYNGIANIEYLAKGIPLIKDNRFSINSLREEVSK